MRDEIAAGAAGAPVSGLGAPLLVAPLDHARAPSIEAGSNLSSDSGSNVDEIDLARSRFYDLLAVLLGQAPTAEVLTGVGALAGHDGVLGDAVAALAAAARTVSPDEASREFFDLFVGVGRGELLPYASYYLTGFLNERPLARVRGELLELGIERSDRSREPEDHIATLLDVMAGLVSGRLGASPVRERTFFERNLLPWSERFFSDLERAAGARFYRHVGALGRLFIEIETEAFTIDG